jgi:hypothetical protein
MKVILEYIFDWLPFGFGVPILIGVGLAMLADEFKAFTAARGCFSLAALWIYGKVFMWAYLTSDRFQIRAVVVFLVFGFVGIGLIEALRLTRHREDNTTTVASAAHDRPKPEPSNSPQPLETPITKADVKHDGTKISHEPKPEIELIFKQSPLFTVERKAKITSELDSFRKYLINVGFEIPRKVPPIGVSKGAPNIAGVSPGTIYDAQIYLKEQDLDNPESAIGAYSLYLFTMLIFPPDASSRFVMPTGWVFADYYYASYTKEFNINPKSNYAGVEQSLHEIWVKRGKDFTDKLLFYTKERWYPPDATDTDFQNCFAKKVLVGAAVTENLGSGSRDSDIYKTFEKNLARPDPHAATQPGEASNTLSKGDRDRLTDAFFEFSKILDQANTAWGKANRIKIDESGLLRKDLETRKSRIPEILVSTGEFEKNFNESRQKWKYYGAQIGFIFGDDPDNHALILRNAVDEYANHLDSVLAIKDSDETNLRKLLWVEDVRYEENIGRFALWKQGCELRLEQAKSSLR